VAQNYKTDLRFQSPALVVLQEAAEDYIVGVMEDSVLCAVHGGRQTLMAEDMALAGRIRGPERVCCEVLCQGAHQLHGVRMRVRRGASLRVHTSLFIFLVAPHGRWS